MKNFFNIYKLSILAVVLFVSASCSDEFLDRPSEDGISLDSYYSSDAQVAAATNGMYSRTWFQFGNKFFYAIGEVGSGNMCTFSSDVNAMRNFSLTGTDGELQNGWQALWANVAQANAIINFLPERVGPAVSQETLDHTVGEAYFIRATAYFYLVRLWGPVPIIENNLDYANSPQINTNNVEDVYKLIISDYKNAIDRVETKFRTSNYASNGHVSKGSARAMLAKVYLYQKDYANAKLLSGEVIASNEFKLLGGAELPGKTFGDLFLTTNNNNEESVFALQWKTDGNYGSANNANTQFGTSATSNASYGGVFAPSQDILSAYSSGDKRKRETFMTPGDTYAIKSAQGTTFTLPEGENAQGSGAAVKKYCIGKVTESTGPSDAWGMMNNNTYIMRYAEVLLIYAEATLGNNASTSDASALSAFNAVRNRAGLSSMTAITFDDIFTERRLELCFEGDYWYDLGRINRAKAIAIMSAQNRGSKENAEYYTPTESDFLIPYPDVDVAKNPKLMEPPVPYTFK